MSRPYSTPEQRKVATCDHKFVDSNKCAKCGWEPPRRNVTQAWLDQALADAEARGRASRDADVAGLQNALKVSGECIATLEAELARQRAEVLRLEAALELEGCR